MTALKHVLDPRAPQSQAKSTGRRFFIHAWQDAAPRTLCDLMDAYWDIPGVERTMRLLETTEPVNCMSCRKSLEVLTRQQIRHLSSAGMEKVLAQIAAMRNGDLSE